MKRVPIVTNFKRPITHLIKLILYENNVKLKIEEKSGIGRFRTCLMCEILIIDT